MIRKQAILKKPRLGVIPKNVSKSTNNLIFISLFFILYITLFIFLKDKLLFTPDFGQSDTYHFYLSAKYYLAENLKHNTLPFWTNNLQGGYPLFSEGQIAALYLPNLILLKFLPFADAYNLLLIFSLFCLSIGFYLFLREFKIPPLIAFLFSLIFTFNGTISPRWVHFSVIQSLSLLPFLFFLIIKYFNSNKKIFLLLFPFTLSQMIFAGHMQIVFISVFGLVLWYLMILKIKLKNNIKIIKECLILIFLIISGIIFSLPQILPNIILSQNTVRALQNDFQTVTAFPLTVTHLMSYINPFIFGNPKLGTYPPFSNNWGIFWENTTYLGYIFFLILLLSILINFRKFLINKLIIYSFLLICFFVLLALGKDSPLYLLFNLFPFNLFRVPSRYMLIVNFLLVFSATILFNEMYKKIKKVYLKLFIILLISVNIMQLILFAFDYHLFVDKEKVLGNPQLVRFLDNSLYLSFNQPKDWNQIFIKKGWVKSEDINAYIFYKNFLYPNSNLVFNKKSFQLNSAGFRLKRADYLNDLIQRNISKNNIDSLLNILGVGNIITSNKTDNNNLQLLKEINYKKNNNIYLYKVKNLDKKFFYIPKKLKKIEYLADFEDDFNKGKLSIENSVVEGKVKDDLVNNEDYKILSSKHSGNIYQIKGEFRNKTYLVFRENYYPEWSLYIDNKKVDALRVNLTHIGVEVPKGEHLILLKYENRHFKLGALISIIYLFLFFLIIKKLKFL